MVNLTHKSFINYKGCLLFLVLYLLTYTYTSAQTAQQTVSARTQPTTEAANPDTILLDVSRNLADQLLPFDTLFQIAVNHSPLMRMEEAVVEGKVANLQLTKVIVLQGVTPFFSYATGNQAYLSTGTVTSDVLQLANGRRMGVNIQIPMSEIIGRRHRISQLKAEVKAVSARRDISKLELKRELHRVYQSVLTTHRLLTIRIKDSQLSMIAYRVAEVEMQQGKITPAALANSSGIYAATQINIEKDRGDLLNSLYDLAALTGVDLNELIAKH